MAADTPETTPEQELPTTAHECLAYIQANITNAEKSGWNDHHRYAFINEAGIMRVAKPLLERLGCALVVSPAEISTGPSVTPNEAVLVGTVTLYAPDGSWITGRYAGGAKDSQGRAVAKAMTDFSKYAVQKFLQIPTEKIDDSDQDGDQTPPPPAATSGQAPAQGQPAADVARPSEQDSASTLSTIQEYVGNGTLDGNKVKAKLGTFGTLKVGDLTKPQLDQLNEWIVAEIAKASAQ